MTDNLRTWPEVVFAQPRFESEENFYDYGYYQEIPQYSKDISREFWDHDEVSESCDKQLLIQYIRADIAKERETKLIEEAYLAGLYGEGSHYLYEDAGLDELK